jgi:hypothetical protein
MPFMHRTPLLFTGLIVVCCGFTSLLHNRGTESAEAKDANHYMWDQLHRGNYDSINQVIAKLKNAWYASPEDPALNTHLGFIYLWKFCERGRGEIDSSSLKNIFISDFFFKKAIELNPDDARLYSLQSSTEMCAGAIKEDLGKIASGYRKGLNAVPKWPQFNRFALAAIEGLMNKNSRLYRQGLRFQWITMNECSCKKYTRNQILKHPDMVITELITELQKSTDPKITRACWNSWIAPHNFEGYLLNFGDMLVKAGKKEEGKRIYEAIKLTPSYNEWSLKNVLEQRISNIDENEKLFNRKLTLLYPKDDTQVFINSRFSCVACHQMSEKEIREYGSEQPEGKLFGSGNIIGHRSQQEP